MAMEGDNLPEVYVPRPEPKQPGLEVKEPEVYTFCVVISVTPIKS
jgi:hypothetical protein